MSDTADDFNFLKQIRQEKRASNREQSAEILQRAGILFESKNVGAHLIVQAGRTIVDFWPGTGKWIPRGQREGRRGVRNLIKFVEQERAK